MCLKSAVVAKCKYHDWCEFAFSKHCGGSLLSFLILLYFAGILVFFHMFKFVTIYVFVNMHGLQEMTICFVN